MIPDFNSEGVLPPYIYDPTSSGKRSPYFTTTTELCRFFATSDERIKILRGFLAFRAMLREIGFSDAYQWLDGSFAENIEKTENRYPNDIDVVTFYRMPPHITLSELNLHHRILIDRTLLKATYQIDHYFVDVSIDDFHLIKHVTYWFGLFSHRRNEVWKGMVYVALDSEDEDRVALKILEEKE